MIRNSSLVVAALGGLLILSPGVRAQSLTSLPSTSPASASPGGANVTVTVTGLPAGALTAAQITVTLTPQVNSADPVVTTTASAVENVYSTQSRVTFRVPSSLTFAAPVAYFVKLAGGGYTSANSATLIVNPPPAVASVSPTYGVVGQTVPVTITGSFSDFTPSVTAASFGSGITVSGLTITSATSATASLAIAAAAALNANNVTMTTGVETAALAGGFSIAGFPSITIFTPTTVAEGQTVTVALIGADTHFGAGTTVTFAGTGVAVNSVSASSAAALAMNITVAGNAPIGSHAFSVVSGPETVSGALGVASPLPVVSAVSPLTGAQGTSVGMTITGQNTHFVAGSTVSFNGGGVTAGTAIVTSATSLIVPVTISSTAGLGTYSVTVTSGTETAPGAGLFTVVPLTAPVTGLVTLSDGATPISGALVRLYQGTVPTLATPQITANSAGVYAFPSVTGAFTVVALNPAKTQVGTFNGSVTSLVSVTANVQMAGTGQVTVNVFDSNGTPVPNANVTLTSTAFSVPADLTSTLSATATANASGVATFPAFFAGAVFVSAGDPVTNHGGTTIGIVPPAKSVTIPLYFNVNEVTAAIFSVLNGVVPGTVGPTATNEAPFRIFSVLNGTVPGTTGTTGTNEAPFRIFSVLNGTVPGTTGATGTNEAPFRIFSVLNGTVPGSTLLTGQNEADFKIFSVGNGTTVAPAILSAIRSAANAGTGSSGVSVNKAHVVLASDRVAAGQTIRIAAALDAPSAATTIEFFINGVSFGTYVAPYGFDLTVPYTVSALRITAVTAGVASEEAVAIVTPAATTRMRGSVTTAEGAPASGQKVSLEYSGLRAELFHFDAPLTTMPDLTGLAPLAVREVSGLDVRNPDGVFGKDPLATGLAPDYAIRFQASLNVAAEGDYVFSLRGQQGVALKVNGETVSDGGRVHLAQGAAGVEAVVFAAAGALDVELMWQPPGQPLQPIAEGLLWVRESGMSTVADLSGQFEFDAVPASLGLVRAVVEGAGSGAVATVASGDVGVVRMRGKVQ